MEELLHPEWSAEKIEQLKGHYQSILSLLGEDVEREGLLKTPERVAKAMLTLTRGYEQDPHAILLGAKFKEEYSQMVIVKDIDFFSLCEHHMLPFYGKAHVAYIPNGYITGLSKIARVVDVFSHRLQVQERMTLQIKECIQETLNPLGVMVVVEAKHMCMQMRGVEKQNAITTTSDFTGAFNQAKTREEFMDLKQDELQFHNPLHRKILAEAEAHLHDPNFTAERYFLAHPDPTISKLAADMINDRYQLSKSNSQAMVKDEERLHELVPHQLIDFKLAILEEDMKYTLQALNKPEVVANADKCLEVMAHFKELSELQKIMAKRAGDRVVLK